MTFVPAMDEHGKVDELSGAAVPPVSGQIIVEASRPMLVTKRLHDGKFHWPRPGDGMMKLSATQAPALIEGLDGLRVHVPRVPKPLHAQ